MEEIDVIRTITGYSYDVSGLILQQIRESGITYNLQQIPGVGSIGVKRLLAAKEMNRLLKIQPNKRMSCSRDGYDYLKGHFDYLDHEKMIAMFMNRPNKVIAVKTISIGGISGTIVDIRIIMKYVATFSASAVILAHNHPSGNVNPSDPDISLTKKCKGALELMDVNLLDHLIIGDNSYYSFADEGKL